jgi:hypothetical protein
MPRRRLPSLLVLSACLGVPGAAAAPARIEAPHIDNFALLDERGRFHELYGYAAAPAIVLFVQGDGCPAAARAAAELEALRSELEPRGVVFLGLDANPPGDRAPAAAAAAGEAGRALPVLRDETQLVAEALGVERTAEAFAIDPARWRLVYRGPAGERLRERLGAQLAGRRPAFERLAAPGCPVALTSAAGRANGSAPSYSRDVAPILARRCRDCHRDGGVAPWAMTGFAVVRGWSPMMREVLRTRRMPPWHADPHVGRFANDLSLTAAETRAIVHWIEAGAPRGDGPDPLADAPAPASPAWALGPPDLVIEAPEQEIPASGVVPYRYESVPVPLERSAWVRAVEIRPTNARVTHHATATIVYPEGEEPPDVEGPRFVQGLFAGYVPGREPEAFPDDTGFFLPRGAEVRFQLHYNTTGAPERDTPRLGLYFAEGEPRHELKIGAAVNTQFEIPAGAPDHEDAAERTLRRDIVVYRLTPHMHYRGRRMAIEARYPDGTRELLLSVPDYRFNWQRQYVLAEPKRLPAGTRIVATAGFDNSARNPANPDPSVPVRWGEQSFEEMLIGYFLYRDAPE